MNREQCKAFRDAGFFDAFIDGKLQIIRGHGNEWREWRDCNEIIEHYSIGFYRIRPKKMPHDLDSAIKAIAQNGMNLYSIGTHEYTIVGLSRDSITLKDSINCLSHPLWKGTTHLRFPNGVPFCREE